MTANKPLTSREVTQRLMLLRMNVQAIKQRYDEDLGALLSEIQALLPKEPNRQNSRFKPGDFARLVPKPTSK